MYYLIQCGYFGRLRIHPRILPFFRKHVLWSIISRLCPAYSFTLKFNKQLNGIRVKFGVQVRKMLAKRKKKSINNEVTFIVCFLNRLWRFSPNVTQILSRRELLQWVPCLNQHNSVSWPFSPPLFHCEVSMAQPASQASPCMPQPWGASQLKK